MNLDLTTKFQDAFRSAARGGAPTRYKCPICNEPSTAGPKLWEHAKQAHPDSPEVAETAEARDLFLAKAYVNFYPTRLHLKSFCAVRSADPRQSRQDKANQAPARRAASKPSSNRKGLAKENSADGLKPVSPQRPLSSSGYAQGQGEWIVDTGKLSIGRDGQGQNQEIPLAANEKGVSHDPALDAPTRKRGAEDDEESPDPQLGNPATQYMTPKGKTAPVEVSIARNQTLGDQGDQTSDLDYKRDTYGATTPLWDPNTDNPPTGKPLPKDRRRLNPAKDHGPKSRKPNLLQRNRRPHVLRRRQEQATSNEPGTSSKEESYQAQGLGTEQARSGDDSPPVDEPPEGLEAEPEMLLQPDTRPISHEQLVVEVKGIYAGLVMVEAKCIDIDERQSAAAQEKDLTKRVSLKDDQWQSLIALHKQLLHEHHDFFLASQHPSASPALSRLAAKYSMPARMWRHGIHAFLEVLRHRLPESLEHMLAFIYIAYSMMALLYETVSTFEDTWIECLGMYFK